MVVSVDGSVTLVKLSQFENALLPMLVTPSGTITLVNPSQ